jgi:CheY-like chemotaxis protein
LCCALELVYLLLHGCQSCKALAFVITYYIFRMSIFKKVLLIDDDYINNFMNELLLQDMKVAEEVVTLTNGQDALKYVMNTATDANTCPELILLDINMPVMNGFEFLEELTRLETCAMENMSVVMLSSSYNKKDVDEARKYNVAAYFNKPLTEDKIQDLMHRLVYKSDAKPLEPLQ